MLERWNEILNGLWLGNFIAAEDISELKAKNIKKILTITKQPGPDYPKDLNFLHKKIEIDDFESENIIKFFGECLKFIEGKEKILVHCMAGASRSATIVIAFLMWKKKMTAEKALEFVQNKREIVYPNDGFLEQLKIFEGELEKNKYDLDKVKFEEIKWEYKNQWS